MIEAFEPGQRIVTAEQLISALAGERNLESSFRTQFRNPVRVKSVDGRLIESPDRMIEPGFDAARLQLHDLERNSERLRGAAGQRAFVEFGLVKSHGHR